MSVLSDSAIEEYLDDGVIEIDDLDDRELQIQPSSVDLRLGHTYRQYDCSSATLNPLNDSQETATVEKGPVDEIVLRPNDFILVPTIEAVSLPDHIQGQVTGRSSFGRCGVEVHSTAGLIDPGFSGQIVLEVSNNSDQVLILPCGARFCQLVFHEMDRKAQNPYDEREDSKYDGQSGPEPSHGLDDP